MHMCLSSFNEVYSLTIKQTNVIQHIMVLCNRKVEFVLLRG